MRADRVRLRSTAEFGGRRPAGAVPLVSAGVPADSGLGERAQGASDRRVLARTLSRTVPPARVTPVLRSQPSQTADALAQGLYSIFLFAARHRRSAAYIVAQIGNRKATKRE